MNKKGIVWVPVILIAGVLGLFLGWYEMYKLKSLIDSIPPILWYFIIFILVLMLLPKKK